MTQNVVFYTVIVEFPKAGTGLLPYMTATVYFSVETHRNVLRVPNAALRWKPSSVEMISPDVRKRESVESTPDVPAATAAGEKRARHRLWAPDGRYVRPLDVEIGISDDIVTEIRGEGVKEGMKVVTGSDADSVDPSNPFLPKMRKHTPPPGD
jgi:HlyD family secretion protein